MKQHFEKQLLDATPLTEEIVEQLMGRKDYLGTELEAGHTVLYCIMQSETSEEDRTEYGAQYNMQIVKVCVESFDILEEHYEYVRHAGENEHLPIFTKKED